MWQRIIIPSLTLAITTAAYNIYQAIGKAQAVGKAVKSAA